LQTRRGPGWIAQGSGKKGDASTSGRNERPIGSRDLRGVNGGGALVIYTSKDEGEFDRSVKLTGENEKELDTWPSDRSGSKKSRGKGIGSTTCEKRRHLLRMTSGEGKEGHKVSWVARESIEEN